MYRETYQIEFTEKQRLALIDALKRAGITDTDESNPLCYFVSGLESLPEVNEPNMLHGFCY